VEVSRVAWRFHSHMKGKLLKMIRIPVTAFHVTMFAANNVLAKTVICTNSSSGQGMTKQKNHF
jgi:hypothetical protein